MAISLLLAVQLVAAWLKLFSLSNWMLYLLLLGFLLSLMLIHKGCLWRWWIRKLLPDLVGLRCCDVSPGHWVGCSCYAAGWASCVLLSAQELVHVNGVCQLWRLCLLLRDWRFVFYQLGIREDGSLMAHLWRIGSACSCRWLE